MKKRSIVIAGHKTSVSLEDIFWQGLREIAIERGMFTPKKKKPDVGTLVAEIDAERLRGTLSSNIRIYVVNYYKTKIPTK